MTTSATRWTRSATVHVASIVPRWTTNTVVAPGGHDWRDAKVREWLLLLLRFAVTRKPLDQSAVLAAADELDCVARRRRPAAASFFARTSNDVCKAILTTEDEHTNAVLQAHAARIDDPRLRRAFQAAVGIELAPEPQQQSARRQRSRMPRKG